MAPALGISIAIAIFAVVTQLLDATGAISLSTTQQLTGWLVAAGLIVLLWIAYMICRAYVTAKRSGEVSAARTQVDAPPTGGQSESPIAKLYLMPPDRPDGPTHVPPEDRHEDDRSRLHEALQHHSPITVDMTDVFSHGCWLAPDPITEAKDTVTGKSVVRYPVLDHDPEHEGPLRQTVVEIAADQKDLPTLVPYEPVKFVGLTVTPDESLRATAIEPATPHLAA